MRRKRPGEGSEGRDGGSADEAAFGAALERVGGPVQVAIVYERDNAPAKIRRVVEKLGIVINCLRPYDNQVGQYAEVFAKNLGLKLSFDAVDLLVARHGSDLAAIHNALAKAAITKSDSSKVEVADLGGGGGPSRIPELFELAESIARGRPGEALTLFDRAIRDRTRCDRVARARDNPTGAPDAGGGVAAGKAQEPRRCGARAGNAAEQSVDRSRDRRWAALRRATADACASATPANSMRISRTA